MDNNPLQFLDIDTLRETCMFTYPFTADCEREKEHEIILQNDDHSFSTTVKPSLRTVLLEA